MNLNLVLSTRPHYLCEKNNGSPHRYGQVNLASSSHVTAFHGWSGSHYDVGHDMHSDLGNENSGFLKYNWDTGTWAPMSWIVELKEQQYLGVAFRACRCAGGGA